MQPNPPAVPPVPLGVDPRIECPARAVELLGAVLDEWPDLFGEWLACVLRNDWRLPPDLLVSLFPRVRAKPEAGKIIATTLDYPMIMDTFGCTPKFLADNPKAAKGLADAGDLLDRKKHAPFLARLEANIGNFERAEGFYTSLLRDANVGLPLLKEYARLQLDLAHYEKALPVLLRILQRQPDDPPTLGSLRTGTPSWPRVAACAACRTSRG